MMDEPRFAQPIPNVTVARKNIEHFPHDLSLYSMFCYFFNLLQPVGRDANLPCVVENLGSYKVSVKSAEITLLNFPTTQIQHKFMVRTIFPFFFLLILIYSVVA
jgi:hypothetical protein